MAAKRNIRSIRISDQIALLIEQQAGNNFTEKWENLVTRCAWELPEREKELQRLDELINRKRRQLLDMSREAQELGAVINDLFPKVKALENAIDRNIKKYEA